MDPTPPAGPAAPVTPLETRVDRAAPPAPRRRPLGRQVVQVLRRLHLYAGLLMLPWVILYGVTAFLFNHPEAFPDQPNATFTRAALRGTPLEALPAPLDLATQTVAALQSRAKEGEKYTLAEPETAKFAREFAFATVKAGDQDINVLVDVKTGGGTVRSRPAAAAAPKPTEERAPFAVGFAPGAGGTGGRGGRTGAPGGREGGRPGGERGGSRDGLKLDNPLHDRVAAAVPAVLTATGFPAGDVTVTSVPDVAFRMTTADGKLWDVTANPQTGVVSGKPAGSAPSEGGELSVRRFLLRLHTAHGYPGDVNAKWVWAVIVDAMAFIMVFWGVSGLFMWWQIKATRWLGLGLLVLSGAGAAAVGIAMHEYLTALGR